MLYRQRQCSSAAACSISFLDHRGAQDKGSSSEAGQHQEQAAETPGKAQRKAVKRLAGRVEDVAHRAVAAGEHNCASLQIAGCKVWL